MLIYSKWCLVRYLCRADHHPSRIGKFGRLFDDRLDFGDMEFPVKTKIFTKFRKTII